MIHDSLPLGDKVYCTRHR